MEDYLLFEILLYRISLGNFNEQSKKHLEKTINSIYRENPKPSESSDQYFAIAHDHFLTYGGPWEYNQSVGAIRIYKSGDQIRANLWLSNKKRFLKIMRNKNISYYDKFFEIWVSKKDSNEQIVTKIKNEISRPRRIWKRVVPDMESFNHCCNFIDWKTIALTKKSLLLE